MILQEMNFKGIVLANPVIDMVSMITVTDIPDWYRIFVQNFYSNSN